MTISPSRLTTSLLAAGAIAIAGCGGGSSSRSSDTLSKTEFQKQANAICKGVNDKVNALATPTGFADVGPYADKVTAITDDALDKLRALKPPKEFQDDFSKWLGFAAGLHETAQKLKDAAAKKDKNALQAAGDEASARDKQADPIAKRIGITTCAES